MKTKIFFFSVMLAITSSLMAAEVYIYDPNKISEYKTSDIEKCGVNKDQACYNILYNGAVLIKNVPENYLPYFINYKNEAISQQLPMRAHYNPLDANLKSPTHFMNCFFTLPYSKVFDSYSVDEIELSCDGYFKNNYRLKLQGGFDYKIDERIYDRINTLKGSATKKKCKIIINTGFFEPLLSNYSRCDLDENFKFDILEDNEASVLKSEPQCPPEKSIEAPKCVICQSEGADLALQPCGHLCAHAACWQKQATCPICKKAVEQAFQVHY